MKSIYISGEISFIKHKAKTFRLCKNTISLFYFFLLCVSVFSQDVSVQHYSVNDGLSQGSVYEIYQAKNGIMWIGTGDGLCSYDGTKYTIYRKNISKKESLLHNRIRKIGEDNIGNIYVNSDVGLNIIDAFSGKVITPTLPNKSGEDSLFFLYAFSNKVYIIKNRNQLWCYHSKEKIFEKKADLKFDLCTPHQTFFIGNEIYYYHTTQGLVCFNFKTLKSRAIKLPSTFFNLFVSNKKLYICTKKGVYRLSDNGKSLIPFLIKNMEPYQVISIDRKDNIWISSNEKGLSVYNSAGLLLYDFPHNYKSQKFDGLSLKDIKIIYTDRSANNWVGTEGNGIVKFNLESNKFKHINYYSNDKKGLSSDFIKCFYQSKPVGKVQAGLWVGTFMGGLNFSKSNGNFIHYNEMKICFGLLQDNYGNMWAASDLGIFIMDTKSGRFMKFKSFLRGYSILKLKSGELLYSDLKGSYIITPNKNNIFNSNIRPFIGCQADALTFFETKNGNIYISVEHNGIFVSNKLSKPQKIGLNTFLEKATVRCIYESDDGTLYLATNSGLAAINSKNEIIKTYNATEGLPNEVLYSVVPDSKGNLWISSNKGLSKFNFNTKKFRNYTVDDGIQSNEFNTGAWYYDSSNSLIYFGGVNGYNVFKPEQIKDNLITPTVMLSGLKVFDKDLFTDTVLNFKKNISMVYNQNALTFEFTAPEFTEYHKNWYAYKLSGVNNEWVVAGNRRYATYGNLAPGKYILWAKASNNDGIWGNPKKLLLITIYPPWWRTLWFYALSGFALVLVIGYLIYRIFTVQLRKQLAEMIRQQEIEAVRSRISRDIHDDVGAGLSHLALSSDLAAMKLGKESELSEQLSELSTNSRKLIDSLSEIIWSVNPRFDNINSMLSYMRSFISEYLEKFEINIHTNIPETLADRTVKPEIRRNIFLVLKESLHNIVKHAKAKNVYIVFKYFDEKFELSITDDGKGMDMNQASEFGNGMINLKRRAEEINGILSIESKIGEGTCIKINGIFM